MKRRVCVVVTARPSYSRIKTALDALRDSTDAELLVVAAASALLDRYGTAVRYIEEDGFELAARVQMVLEGGHPLTMAKTTGIGLMEFASVFDHLRPDVVVSIADRFETMATAVAAAYMNIPLAHIQGGEVTGSIDEKVRHAVSKLADLHLVASRPAARRLRCMGEQEASIHVTGCPSIDLAAEVARSPALDFDPFERYGGVGARPQLDMSSDYMVVMQHPVTTEFEQARAHVTETLHAVADMRIPALWFWPNVDAGSDGTSGGIRAFREARKLDRIHFFKGMAPVDFLRLLAGSRCLVGNSSVGIRECSYLGVPTVNIGSRQSGRDRGGNVVDVDYAHDDIADAIREQVRVGRYPRSTLYGDGCAGRRIGQVLSHAPLSIEKRLCY